MDTIKQVKCFQTTDGDVFVDQTEAIKHQQEINMDFQFKKMVDMSDLPDEITKADLIEFLKEKISELSAIYRANSS